MKPDSELLQQLSFIEQENGVWFALKWTAVGTVIAAFLLVAGCSAFFPKETPRYNAVAGERRAPTLNAQMLAAQQQPPQQNAPVPMVHAQQPPSPVSSSTMPQSARQSNKKQPTRQQQSAPNHVQQQQQTSYQHGPVPTAQAQQTPSPARSSTTPQPARQSNKKQPTRQQQPSATAQQPSAQDSSTMIDQLTGFFSTDPQAANAQSTPPYPTLPPSNADIRPSATSQKARHAAIEEEIAALERELASSSQQQTSLNTSQATNRVPDDQMVKAPAPAWNAPPPPERRQPARQMASAELADSQTTLPPPPLPSRWRAPASPSPKPSAQTNVNNMQQPSPEQHLYEPAPVISAKQANAHQHGHQHAQQQVSLAQPDLDAYNTSVEVPMAPPVQQTNVSRLPSGLIPPDMRDEFEEGYLPPSRYSGRRPRY